MPTRASTYRQYRNVDRTALDRLMDIDRRREGKSAHVPAAAGTPAKQEAVIRLGSNPDMVAPIWENMSPSFPTK